MSAATQSAPVRHWHADAGARTPSLDRKAGTVDPIMHQRLIRRAQLHAARPAPQADPLPMDWQAIADRVGKISGVIADAYRAEETPVPAWLQEADPGAVRITPVSAPGHPESLTAELDPASEIYLAALSNDLWEHDEYLDITADGEQR